MLARKFLGSKIRALAARARRLARIDGEAVGIRPQDRPYAPSEAHFHAANQRLAAIDAQVARRLEHLQGHWQSEPLNRVLIDIALVEREVDRARRAFGLFFEIFSQRGSVFAPTLAAHDVIAADCYAAIRQAAPRIFRGPLLKPICYMEHGFSPATMRRGVQLNRLLGEPNPFPIVRIPWDRDNPWQAVFLHEVSHNLQADLGIWQENRQAVVRRVIRSSGDPGLTRIWGVWHKEIFADLAAILLGGPAAAWGMATARDLRGEDFNVVAVIGEVASKLSLAGAPVCQEAGVPMISPSSTNPRVTEVGDYIFRVCFIDPFQGVVMAAASVA